MSEIAKAFTLPSVSKSSVISGWKLLDIYELINLARPSSSVIKKLSLISCAPLCGISNFLHFLVQPWEQYFSRIRTHNILSEFSLLFAMPSIQGLCNQWQDYQRLQWAYSIVIRHTWDLEILMIILAKYWEKHMVRCFWWDSSASQIQPCSVSFYLSVHMPISSIAVELSASRVDTGG